jgi:octaprenyl-diphosphate synthase
MTNDIRSVFSAVEPEMQQFRSEFDKLVRSDVKMLQLILKYLFKKRGKQVRPLFVILSAGMCGKIDESTYRAAALIELLHTATLVHDDVVDEADHRRGMFTVNALWKNKAAVLLGDYLLATGLLSALDHDYFQLLKYVARATRKMSEGELWQIQKARKIKPVEEDYYKIIEYKTAVLFAVSFQSGAYTAGADQQVMETLYNVGLYAGIAFQIRDDILDFNHDETGKGAFTDLKEQKLTLPVIHALNHSSLQEAVLYKRRLRQIRKKRTPPETVVNWLKQKGSIEYAEVKMLEYRNKAFQQLHSLEKNTYRDLIEQTIFFLTERKY